MSRKVQANKISLKYYTAEEMLREIYSSKTVNEDFEYLQNVGYDYLPTENVLKTYARAFKIEVNKKAALLVLETLSEKKRELMRLKYGEEKQLVAISLLLNMSVGQLMNWNRSIVDKIASFMSYCLTEEDVFCIKKVSGMIELLSMSVEFFSILSRESLDIRQDWLEELERRKNNYQKLLIRIERFESECDNECDKTTFKEVVGKKIKNPDWTIKDIAERCRLEQSVVGKYLKRFFNSVKEYLK